MSGLERKTWFMYYNSLLYWLSQNEVTYYEVSPLHVMCLLLLSLSVFSFKCGRRPRRHWVCLQWAPAVGPALTQVSADCRAPQAEGRGSLPGAVINITKLGHSLVLISHWFILQHSTQPNQTKGRSCLMYNSMYQLMYCLCSLRSLCNVYIH